MCELKWLAELADMLLANVTAKYTHHWVLAPWFAFGGVACLLAASHGRLKHKYKGMLYSGIVGSP